MARIEIDLADITSSERTTEGDLLGWEDIAYLALHVGVGFNRLAKQEPEFAQLYREIAYKINSAVDDLPTRRLVTYGKNHSMNPLTP